MTRVIAALAAVALLATACSDDSSVADSPSVAGDPSPDDGSSPDGALSADGGSSLDDGSSADGGSDAETAGITATAVEPWSLTEITRGIKPVLAIDPAGQPAIAFLDERLSEGYVSFASAADGWTVDEFVEGYFYGPIGLAFDPGGSPHVVYHDHQSTNFEPTLGDLTHAVRGASGWVVGAAADDGHDGWDSVITIAEDGVVRAAGIDPSQFGSTDGVEYYELVDDTWEVTSISDGEPIAYEFNVDLQVAPDGTPALTYFHTNEQNLVIARRGADGVWTRETVDSDGDVGRYSSLAFSPDGAAHIAYWDASNREVKHATDESGTWAITPIGPLESVIPGQQGARRIVAIDVDSSGTPVAAFSDTTGIWFGRAEAGGWTVDQIVSAGSRPLGQLVSMRLDPADTAHLAFFEVTDTSPLEGVIGYLAAG